MNSFGKLFRRTRRNADLSLTKVANYLNVSVVFLSSVERGKARLDSSLIKQLVGLFDKDSIDLLFFEDMETNKISEECCCEHNRRKLDELMKACVTRKVDKEWPAIGALIDSIKGSGK